MRTSNILKSCASRATKLGFENLENRTLLAGNVKAAITGGNLTLTGDNSANQVQAWQSAPKQWKVQGLGTTVNGTYSIKTYNNVQSIEAVLKNGADVITVLNGSLPGGLFISTGNSSNDGNDVVSIANIRSTIVEVLTGSGSDAVAVSGLTAQNLLVRLGSGNNTATIVNTTLSDSLGLDAGNGTDSVTLSRVNAAFDIEVFLGDGKNDTLAVAACTADFAGFDGGNDSGDTLVLSANTFDDLAFVGFKTVVGA